MILIVCVLKLANLICNLNLSEMIEKLIVFDHQKASKSGVPVVVPFNQFWAGGFLSKGERTQKMGRSEAK